MEDEKVLLKGLEDLKISEVEGLSSTPVLRRFVPNTSGSSKYLLEEGEVFSSEGPKKLDRKHKKKTLVYSGNEEIFDTVEEMQSFLGTLPPTESQLRILKDYVVLDKIQLTRKFANKVIKSYLKSKLNRNNEFVSKHIQEFLVNRGIVESKQKVRICEWIEIAKQCPPMDSEIHRAERYGYKPEVETQEGYRKAYYAFLEDNVAFLNKSAKSVFNYKGLTFFQLLSSYINYFEDIEDVEITLLECLSFFTSNLLNDNKIYQEDILYLQNNPHLKVKIINDFLESDDLEDVFDFISIIKNDIAEDIRKDRIYRIKLVPYLKMYKRRQQDAYIDALEYCYNQYLIKQEEIDWKDDVEEGLCEYLMTKQYNLSNTVKKGLHNYNFDEQNYKYAYLSLVMLKVLPCNVFKVSENVSKLLREYIIKFQAMSMR